MPNRSPAQKVAPVAVEFIGGRKTAIAVATDGRADTVQVAPVVTSGIRAGSGGGLLHTVAAAFLPEGYPDSVSSDYLSYQLWDSIQGLSSYVRGMLSSQAMLTGVGVGSAAATPLGAAFQFFVKDFTGMLGGILFASAQGSGLDCYAKQWRLFADIMNDIGLALELASPLLPRAFLLLACLGSLARAVTGVAGGATRMALTQHFALARNAADIAAKEGSQETAVTIVGMLLGMALLRFASDMQPLLWAAFWALTVLHVWANVKAMRCLRIASLNQARLGLLLRHYLVKGKALTPEEMAAQESLVPPPLQLLLRRLRVGFGGVPRVALAPRLPGLSPALQRQLVARMSAAAQAPSTSAKQYVAAAAPSRRLQPDAAVLLRQAASTADVLEGYCAALMLAWRAQLAAESSRGRGLSTKLWPAAAQLALADVDAWLAAADAPHKSGGNAGSRAAVSQETGSNTSSSSYRSFLAALEAAGWQLDRVALLQGPSRVAWGADLRAE